MLAIVFAQCLYSSSVSLLYMKCKPAVKKGPKRNKKRQVNLMDWLIITFSFLPAE